MTHDWSKAVEKVAAGLAKAEPAEWKPDRGEYEEREARVVAEHMRSVPLNYQSLAAFRPGVLEGIEANARVDLIRAMDQQGLSPDERSIKVHWQLVMEGYGFRMPEGFIHPEAPPEEQTEGRNRWRRACDGAASSLYKAIHCMVWVRKARPTKEIEASDPIALPAPDTKKP